MEGSSNEVIISMTEELDRLSPMTQSRCIFRVPDRLRRTREKDVHYTPQLISIGPLHHGKPALEAMEEHKNRYLQYFLCRMNNLRLDDCVDIIKRQESRLRRCYSMALNLTSDDFVRMILVDAIFVIEFLFRYWYPEWLDENDCIFGKPLMANDIWPDLLMLENQLPFFILEELFIPHVFFDPSKHSNICNGVEGLSIRFLSYNFLDNCGTTFPGMLENLETISKVEVQHFVDLLRNLCIAPILEEMDQMVPSHHEEKKKKGQSERRYPTTSPSIEELHLAGVIFRVQSTHNLFDIQFKGGILKIPKLKTEDTTELILRNLVAFEQCTTTFGESCYISDYVSIMDQFVNTPEDVELLIKYRIIENYLGGGSNELSTMINSLSAGVKYNSLNFYGILCENLNKFCCSKWHRFRANLKQKYFAVGFFILILTVVQTFCSIISLFWR